MPAGPARRGGHRTSARTPRNTRTLGCGPAWGRRHPRAHTGIIVRERACTHRLRHIHACMCSWKLAHELTLGRACAHAHRSIHTHTYMSDHRQSMAKYTQTLPLAHPPKQGHLCAYKQCTQNLKGSGVRHTTHSLLPPPQKGAPNLLHTPPGLQAFLSTPPAPPPASASPSTRVSRAAVH